MGKLVTAHEIMPPSESWGTRGWTYVDLSSARAKFDQLVEARVMSAARRPRNTQTVSHRSDF
jgi:hypothetical protein